MNDKLKLFKAIEALYKEQPTTNDDLQPAIQTLREAVGPVVSVRMPVDITYNNRLYIVKQMRYLNPDMPLIECKKFVDAYWPAPPACSRFHEDSDN